jgi:endonuclease III related protein
MKASSCCRPSARLLLEVFHLLLDHFGPQHWWPGDSPLEVMVGAILTQNTAWANVEKAISALKESGDLSLQSLTRMSHEAFSKRIRACGFFRVKARRLKNLLDAVDEITPNDLEGFLSLPTGELRRKLLAVPGVGPETADSILLYAAQRPIFVVDAYTRRALAQHGWASPKASYEEVQSLFMETLQGDVALYNECHALWVALGKAYCRPNARCSGCPLEEMRLRNYACL